jgi:hypothetical protein
MYDKLRDRGSYKQRDMIVLLGRATASRFSIASLSNTAASGSEVKGINHESQERSTDGSP